MNVSLSFVPHLNRHGRHSSKMQLQQAAFSLLFRSSEWICAVTAQKDTAYIEGREVGSTYFGATRSVVWEYFLNRRCLLRGHFKSKKAPPGKAKVSANVLPPVALSQMWGLIGLDMLGHLATVLLRHGHVRHTDPGWAVLPGGWRGWHAITKACCSPLRSLRKIYSIQ